MANSKRICKYCKEYYLADDMVKLPFGWFCNHAAAIKFGIEKTKVNKSKAFKKECNDDRRKAKENKNSHQLSLTQDSFNKMRRLEELLWFQERGLEPYCISCLKPLGNDVWCCGHYKSRGANSYLRFDRKNTALQHNVRCNSGLSGNIEGAMNTVGYKEGLKHRYGDEVGNEIIEYCETAPRERDWKTDELKALRKEFNIEIRRLQGLLDF